MQVLRSGLRVEISFAYKNVKLPLLGRIQSRGIRIPIRIRLSNLLVSKDVRDISVMTVLYGILYVNKVRRGKRLFHYISKLADVASRQIVLSP